MQCSTYRRKQTRSVFRDDPLWVHMSRMSRATVDRRETPYYRHGDGILPFLLVTVLATAAAATMDVHHCTQHASVKGRGKRRIRSRLLSAKHRTHPKRDAVMIISRGHIGVTVSVQRTFINAASTYPLRTDHRRRRAHQCSREMEEVNGRTSSPHYIDLDIHLHNDHSTTGHDLIDITDFSKIVTYWGERCVIYLQMG